MNPPTYPFKLPSLAFDYDALWPSIDETTMRIHHGKHHQGYVDKTNAALKDYPDLHNLSIEDLLRRYDDLPESIQPAIRKNGGGHANHQFFWKILRPEGVEGAGVVDGTVVDGTVVDGTGSTAGTGGVPSGELAAAIKSAYGDVNHMKEVFADAAMSVFGSGWAFLVADPKTYALSIVTTANQDSVLMKKLGAGMFCLDLWEHAYYLNYQNRRADYINAFWRVLAWDIVSRRYDNLRSGADHL